MILPLHEQLKARVRAVLAERYDITDPDLHIPVETPPNRTLGDLGTPVAFDLARRLRKAPRVIAQEIADCARAGPRRHQGRGRAERLPERVPRSARVPAGAPRPGRHAARRAGAHRQDHRRAHRDQPEQGGAHRPPAQLGARRHAGARAALPRHAGRSAELHRRHRRPGRRRRGRLPRVREDRSGRRSSTSPRRRASTTTAGTSTPASPSGTTATRSA